MHNPQEHRRQCKAARQRHVRLTLHRLCKCDNLFLENSITIAEDERTDMAKNNNNNAKRNAIDMAHSKRVPTHIGWVQRGCNLAYKLSSAFNKTIQKLNKSTQHVRFAAHASKRRYHHQDKPIMITYNSGANGNYLSERDCVQAGLLILKASTRKVGVANSGTSQAQHVTQLPFQKLSARARQADTFPDFPTSLMSIGKTSNDGTILIFNKIGVTVHREEDVLITCKGEPILIEVQDKQGRYRIPLVTTTRTVATAAPLQTSAEDATTSQQCLRSPFYQTSNQMDACSLRIPCQVKLAQSHQGQELRRLADDHKAQCPKILPRGTQDCQGAFKPNTKECTLHQRKTCPIRNVQHLAPQRQEST